MAESNPPAAQSNVPDQAFFVAANDHVELSNRQARHQGTQKTGLASLYGAARFNAHAYLESVPAGEAAQRRVEFMDYMGTLFRRMLNEHLDNLGDERGIDVGESELAEVYAANGVQRRRAGTDPAPPQAPVAGE